MCVVTKGARYIVGVRGPRIRYHEAATKGPLQGQSGQPKVVTPRDLAHCIQMQMTDNAYIYFSSVCFIETIFILGIFVYRIYYFSLLIIFRI